MLEAVYNFSLGLIGQISHGDRIQKTIDVLGELFPNRTAYAGLTYSAVLDRLILETRISVKRRLDQSHYVTDGYFRRVPSQNISTVRASHAFHYIALSKLLKELLKE